MAKWDEVTDFREGGPGNFFCPPFQRFSELGVEKPTEWVVPGFLAKGKVTVLDGEPGVGKTLFVAGLIGALTECNNLPTTGYLPDDTAKVLLVNPVDDPDAVLFPALEAANAIPSEVQIVTGRAGPEDSPVRLPAALNWVLMRAIRWKAGLVVFDGWEKAAGRDALKRLVKQLATGCEFAALVVRSLPAGRKPGADPGVPLRFALTRHPADPHARLLIPDRTLPGHPLAVSRLSVAAYEDRGAWMQFDAHEDAVPAGTGSNPRDQAVRWLLDSLAGGPLPAKQVEVTATAGGISFSTLKRAKAAAGVKTRQLPGGGWEWFRPDAATAPAAG
jgi:putative DNA primase/helicase